MPDVILTDLEMPGMDGLDLLAALRSRHETRAVAAIVYSGRSTASTVEQAFEWGASDFVAKPTALSEIVVRIRNQLRIARTIAMLEDACHRDVLTGLLNRQGAFEAMHRELARVARNGGSVAVVLLALEAARRAPGARVQGCAEGPRAFARVLERTLRATDIAACLDDRFVLVLPGTSHAEALRALDRVREELEAHGFGRSPELSVGVTVVGVTEPPRPVPSPARVLEWAEEALEEDADARTTSRRERLGRCSG